MNTAPWDPKEAGKLANANDEETARLQKEQAAINARAAEMERYRWQYANSVIGPVLQQIKRHSKQICAIFNTQIGDGRNKANIDDANGLGFDDAPDSFMIVRGSRNAKFTSRYDSDWVVELLRSDGQRLALKVIEGSNATRAALKGPDHEFTEEELAKEACRFVCQ